MKRFWKTLSAGFTNHPDYKAAMKFKETFEPKVEHDYSWVLNYAESIYSRLETTFRELDSKADSIIKYLGGGGGLLTLGAIAGVSQQEISSMTYLILWGIPPAVFAMVSIVFAAIARSPTRTHHPPSVEGAVKYAEHFKDKSAEAAFLGQWHVTCEGMRLAAQRKSWWVKYSTLGFAGAVAALILSLGAVVYELVIATH